MSKVEAGLSPQQLEVLYRRESANLYRYALTLVRDRATAEDIVASTFEKAWRKRLLFLAHRGKPEAWIFQIARNLALDELRRQKRQALPLAELPEIIVEEDSVEDLSRRQLVSQLLKVLDDRDRELVALKFWTDLSNTEIAKVLGISESNVSTRLQRALEKMRKELP